RAGEVYYHFSNAVVLSTAAQYIQAASELGQCYRITRLTVAFSEPIQCCSPSVGEFGVLMTRWGNQPFKDCRERRKKGCHVIQCLPHSLGRLRGSPLSKRGPWQPQESFGFYQAIAPDGRQAFVLKRLLQETLRGSEAQRDGIKRSLANQPCQLA